MIDFNAKNIFGETFLHVAAMYGHTNVIEAAAKVRKDYGIEIDFNAKSNGLETPRDFAYQYRQPEALCVLDRLTNIKTVTVSADVVRRFFGEAAGDVLKTALPTPTTPTGSASEVKQTATLKT